MLCIVISTGSEEMSILQVVGRVQEVVAKKLKEDLLAAVPLEGHGETKCQEEMKLKSRIFDEDRIYLKMDKLIDLVQLLVVLCLVMTVIVLLGVVVLISK